MTALKPRSCWLLLLLMVSAALTAQDPFFTHFTGNEALFNPALTGMMGATTFSLKNKQQWQHPDHNGYQTSSAVYEESMPCSMFDYGLSFVHDREGQGLLRTLRMGGMLAAYVPFGRNAKNVRPADLRIGAGLHWGQQTIDFSRLTFIDQLHPKYGRVGPDQQAILSSFAAPNGGQSDWYFQPSVGFNLRGIILASRARPVFASIGGAVHNLVPLVNGDQGQNWSLLGLGTSTVPRYSFHAEAEGVIREFDKNNFLSLQPRIAGQMQGGLSYLEAGIDVGFSQRFSAGAALHTATTNAEAPATNWASLRMELGLFNTPRQRLDLGFSYNFNLSGLRNFVGNTLEFTARWSLATSVMCRLRGQKASYDDGPLPCPTARGGRGRDKIYENIWNGTRID